MTLRYEVAPLSGRDTRETDAWEQLADDTDAPPFLRLGWMRAWCNAFGGRLQLHCIWRGTELVAALPLLRQAGRLSSPTNWHSVEGGWISRDQQATSELINGLLREGPVVSLGHLRGDQPSTFEALSAAAGCQTVRWVQQRSPWISITEDWTSYAAALDQRWLRQLARRRKQLETSGTVTFETSTGGAGLVSLLDEGFQLEAAGWKGHAGSSVLASQATRDFYYGLAAWASERSWLRLGFLRLDGLAIAFDFALEHGGTHYFLKTGFDPSLRKSAPGLLLRHDMIKHAFETGMSAYALLGADEQWKLRWSNRINEAVRVMAFPRSVAGFIQFPVYRWLRPIGKLGQTQVRRVRDAANRLRRRQGLHG